jgi:Alpha/beta hydrolase domain
VEEASEREATISGPISGGSRGRPFGYPDSESLAQKGYVLEEYLARGTARAYQLAGGQEPSVDGRWLTTRAEEEPFVTRFCVVRPIDRDAFNGVVVVNWQNVSAGFDMGAPTGDEIFRGYVWVGVTTQALALHGFRSDSHRLLGSGATTGLLEWDPDRYGSLVHPGDRFSYDIFAQVGAAIKNQSNSAVLGGLRPSITIATGASQSASRLKSFINIAQIHDSVYEGFLLLVCSGACYPPDDKRVELTEGGASIAEWQFRDDLAAPIFVVNSEAEAWTSRAVRQPNTETFRYWEIAGSPHGGGSNMMEIRSILERDGSMMAGMSSSSVPPNTVNWSYVADAALRSITTWIRQGISPPEFPYIEQRDGDPSSSVARDHFGIAIGGLRLPEIEVPTMVQVGFGDTLQTRMAGSSRPLTKEELDSLYSDKGTYLKKFDDAVDKLSEEGALLPEDVAAVKLKARAFAEKADFD